MDLDAIGVFLHSEAVCGLPWVTALSLSCSLVSLAISAWSIAVSRRAERRLNMLRRKLAPGWVVWP